MTRSNTSQAGSATASVPAQRFSLPDEAVREDLHRGLKERHVQMIAIGGAIGVGLFLGSAKASQNAGPSLLLTYAVAGAAIFLFGEFEFWFAIIKVATIIGMIVLGLAILVLGISDLGHTATFSHLWSAGGFFPKGFKGPFLALQAVMFAFLGVFSKIGIPTATGIINFVVLTAALSSCNSGIFGTGRCCTRLLGSVRRRPGCASSAATRRRRPG